MSVWLALATQRVGCLPQSPSSLSNPFPARLWLAGRRCSRWRVVTQRRWGGLAICSSSLLACSCSSLARLLPANESATTLPSHRRPPRQQLRQAPGRKRHKLLDARSPQDLRL